MKSKSRLNGCQQQTDEKYKRYCPFHKKQLKTKNALQSVHSLFSWVYKTRECFILYVNKFDAKIIIFFKLCRKHAEKTSILLPVNVSFFYPGFVFQP
jgi:hypothetical protein